jgi:excisionase family DNA binding protein
VTPDAGVPPLLITPDSSEAQGGACAVPPMAVTVKEAAMLVRLDARTIRAMVLSGELEGNQRGHAIRVSRASVLDWLRGKRRVPRSKR